MPQDQSCAAFLLVGNYLLVAGWRLLILYKADGITPLLKHQMVFFWLEEQNPPTLLSCSPLKEEKTHKA